MRRIIMASIIAVAFIPGVASAQMRQTANDTLGYVNALETEKKSMCTLHDNCAELYDVVISNARSIVFAQKQLVHATAAERNSILDEIIRLVKDNRDPIARLMEYRKSRGIVISAN